MNQNWSRSSFPKPLNKGNFIVFSILNHGGGGGGTGEIVGEGGEVGGGVGGRMESEGVKMGFFERVRARKEAKRRAWMEKRGGRGGFGCRGGRRMHCMS